MKVAIFGQYYQNDTRPIIRDIFVFFNANNVEMVIEENFLKILYEQEIVKKEYKTFNSHKCLDSSFDILVSIGGDGTILRAATFVRDSGVPIIGINAGRLGFLAKVQKESIEQFLQIVLEKKYTISRRTLLILTCSPENEQINELNFAMNEVTVSRKDTTSMITIETYLNDEYLNSYWADGLIISTPTDLPNFEKLLGDGHQIGCKFSYKVQEVPNGLAQAFVLGEEFVGKDKVALILGDNIFYGSGLQQLIQENNDPVGGMVFAYHV
ncbi:MAG: NAD(+)/NADH kinase, partial [Flavobacterium sp.]